MYRRESRDSDSKRQRSRFDRQPSPKRSRRDGKPEAERVLSKSCLETRDDTGAEQKRHQHLQDAAPHEPDTLSLSKDPEKRHDGMTKNSPNLSEVPRSQSYYQQHDDRVSAGRGDRRATAERGWWRGLGAGHQINRRALGNERPQQSRDDDKSIWRHDMFRENEDNQDPPTRKRPAFRERRIQVESGQTDRRGAEFTKKNNHDHQDLVSERKEERDRRNIWYSERHDGMRAGKERMRNKGERFGDTAGGGRQGYRANYRDRFNSGRQGFGGSRLKDEEKWEHDLFDEANKSPPRKNEEEQIAKIEALLSS